MQRVAPLLLVALLPGAGCVTALSLPPAIAGSGVAREEARKVGAFHALEVSGVIATTVRVGSETTVRISGDDNIVPLVITEVSDGRLSIRMKDSNPINPKQPLKAEITTPKLDWIGASGAVTVHATGVESPRFKVHASGASQVTVSGIKADHVEFEASGACQLTASGNVKDLKVGASGASQIHAEQLDAESAEVDVSGASNAEVKAAKAVRGDASGASTIKVMGKPESKAVTTTGVSTVKYEGQD